MGGLLGVQLDGGVLVGVELRAMKPSVFLSKTISEYMLKKPMPPEHIQDLDNSVARIAKLGAYAALCEAHRRCLDGGDAVDAIHDIIREIGANE